MKTNPIVCRNQSSLKHECLVANKILVHTLFVMLVSYTGPWLGEIHFKLALHEDVKQ